MLAEDLKISRSPIYNAEFSNNLELLKANERVREAVVGTFSDYHLRATASSGGLLVVPCTYQINEPGFNPFLVGKATADQLQAKLDDIVSQAQQRQVTLGLDNEEALRKLLLQNGLGIDCSNFAFRAMSRAHNGLDLAPYPSFLYKRSADLLDLVDLGRWSAVADDGHTKRDLALDEQFFLVYPYGMVTAGWISDKFGKDPAYISSAADICSDEATIGLSALEVVPGDLVSFRRPSADKVSHIALVSNVERSDGIHGVSLEIMDSRHTRGYDSGLGKAWINFGPSGFPRLSSHSNLINPNRHDKISFRRPKAIDAYYQERR